MDTSLGRWLRETSLPFVGVGPDGVVAVWNAGAAALLGPTGLGEAFVARLPARFDASQRAQVWRRITRAAESGAVVEQLLDGPDGEVLVEVQPHRWGEGYALVLRDLTRERATRDELVRLASFPALNPSPCVELDTATGAVLYQNDAAADVGIEALVAGLVEAFRDPAQRLFERQIEVGDRVWLQRVQRMNTWGRLRVYAQDVTAVARAQRELEERVRERTEELEAANAMMHLEVEERARAERAALDASKAKSHFLANMSHELRTPLNAIIGYSELLIEEAEDPVASDLSKIHGAARHLLDLISSILDLSKIEAGRMELHLEEVPPGVIVDTVVDAVEPLVARRGNRFVIDRGDALPPMRTDVVKVRQVLMNVLGNAAKFTEGGEVGLEVFAHGAEIRFVVRDTGIGMTKEQLGRLFQAFVQADSSTTRRFGGTGLGLAISREFVRMLGGSITATSAAGEGTTFVIALPTAGP